MNLTLVIAEKPSVGMSIAAVLGAKERREGYVEGNGYLVSWCFGHIGEMASAETYDEKYAVWRRDDLPILPETWSYKVSRDKFKQYEILRKLLHRTDVVEVVNACDAGREGERIFRGVYTLAGCNKPVKRLWISSMEDEAIRQGFHDLRAGSEYDNLYAAADCRAKADWLVGINATRLFSTLYHRTLNVGRVVSPTLALIVQRDAEIRAFRPEPFYTVEISLPGNAAASERLPEKETADNMAGSCRGKQIIVKEVRTVEKSEKPPALYDLTTLQRDANRTLGYTAQQTLDYAQALYEKKLCTYPRTDSRFLTEDMEGSVFLLVETATHLLGAEDLSYVNSTRVCDSRKVSDHHAIVPTVSAKSADVAALPTGEHEVLKLISRRLLCAVSSPYLYTETIATLECDGFLFTCKGKTVRDQGWKRFMSQDATDEPFPAFYEGQQFDVQDAAVKEGKTTPPKQYTEDSLLSAMETAGAKETPEDAERKGLGTPATRAAIIEKLVASGFVTRKKAKKTVSLVPTSIGASLITVLPEQLQSPLLTAEWEHKLVEIERGALSPDVFLAEIAKMVRELVQTYQPVMGAEVLFPSGRPVVGTCPRCGGDVTESKLGFFCERSDCRFGLWRDNKFLTAKRIQLNKELAATLLKDGRAAVKNIYSERTGKFYDAALVLEDTGQQLRYKLDF